MGWCSGTELFDRVVGRVLCENISTEAQESIVKALILAMWEQDWDCETDSDYFNDPIVKSAFCFLNPDLQKYYEEMENN